jgi:dipeptidyl aminopeptidase/acylaminoacyl peptidase
MRRNAGYPREFEAFSPDGSHLAFRTGHGGYRDQGELWMASFDRRGRVSIKPLVTDPLSSRLQTFMHFAGGGAAWSPDNRHVAFPAVDTTKDQHLQVYVVDTETGALERWTDDSSWKFSVAWHPDGRRLAVGTGDPVSRTATLLLLDTAGDAHEIIRVQGRWFTDLLWSPDGTRLLAARDAGGPLLAHLVSEWSAQVEETTLPRLRFVGFTPDGDALIARRAEGMSSAIVLVERSTGRVSDLISGDILFSAIGIGASTHPSVIFTAESGSFPREVRVAKLDVRSNRLVGEKVIVRATGAGNRLPFGYRVYRWQSPSGKLLETKLYLPRFKAARPPPLVVVPYGGYTNSFDDPQGFLEQGLLELIRRGWAVALPNTRCAASDESCVGHYGDVQLADTEQMVETLGVRQLVDPHRTAVIGHSHGGTMAYYYATHSPRFCAVIAINGRADWEAQARYGDGYLVQQMGGLPASVPNVYKEFSPLRNVDRVTTPVLAVAGRRDTQILPSNASAIVTALHAANKRGELLEFPDEGHLIVKPENIRRLWQAGLALLDDSCSQQK